MLSETPNAIIIATDSRPVLYYTAEYFLGNTWYLLTMWPGSKFYVVV
jgi:hypothetical protein